MSRSERVCDFPLINAWIRRVRWTGTAKQLLLAHKKLDTSTTTHFRRRTKDYSSSSWSVQKGGRR